MRPKIAHVLATLAVITVGLPAASALAASTLAPAPSTGEDCAYLSSATLPPRNASYGWKVPFYNSTFTGSDVSYAAGTNICNGSDAMARATLVIDKGTAMRALGAAVTVTVIGNTDSDRQNTNNAYLSIQRALYGRWLAERSMGLRYGALPAPSVSTSGAYYVFTYNYPSGGDVVVRTKGAGADNATGTTTAGKRLDRNATVDITVGTPPPTTSIPPQTTVKPGVAPTAVAETFDFTYGDSYKGDVSRGDTCSAAPCIFTVKPIPASQGSLSITGGGIVTFSPPQYFTGEVKFEYTITASNGLTDSAIDTIKVSAPAFPAFQAPVSSVQLTAPVWARLGVNEKFSLSSSVTCPAGVTKYPAHPNRCTSDPAGIVGTYVEVSRVRVTGVSLNAPNVVPAPRGSITSSPTNTALPTSGTVKFDRATQARYPFTLLAGVSIQLRFVKFTRLNGVYKEFPEAASNSFQYSSASASIGVVGNTSR